MILFWAHNTTLYVKNFYGNNERFIFYFIQALDLSKFNSGSAVPTLNRNDIHELTVIVPSLIDEQKRIVGVLSTWDQAIEKLGKLISAKEKQFKWLLKRLITDQKNNSNWERAKLGELGIVSSSGVDKKVIEGEESVRLVNYLDVLNRNFICSDDLSHWVTAPKNKIEKCNIKKGDIFFTPSSEIQGDIAHSAVAIEDIKKAVYSYHVVCFRLKENWDIMFRSYIFKSDHFYKQAYSLCQGSGQRYVISQDDFRKMDISFPSSVLEQKRIANILNTKEIEIKTLQNLSNKYQSQKKGLMQKLLTGKVRLQ
ncbi:MAG: restriction endonuclease subunit S [Bdellovibrionales bacterium]|nr:restriction endonuclease subunit S [Bdellovibrionales bacterium]